LSFKVNNKAFGGALVRKQGLIDPFCLARLLSKDANHKSGQTFLEHNRQEELLNIYNEEAVLEILPQSISQ